MRISELVLSLTIILLTVVLLRGSQMLREERARRGRLEEELSALSGLMDLLQGSDWQRSLDGLLAGLVQRGHARAACLLVAADGGFEHRAAAHGPDQPTWDPLADPGILHQAVESKLPVRGTEASMLPLLEEGDVIGVLALRGGGQESTLVQAVARLAGLALGEIRLFRRQAALSSTDGLTGLANHRHFQQSLSIAIGQVYLENDPLALLLLDIDHFKQVNDNHGHQFGDLVLREIGYLLRSTAPVGSLIARYGGEEMAVLLQGPSAGRAQAVAEEMRTAIAGHEFWDFQSGNQIRVTVSLGVAGYEPGEGKNRFISRADAALYASKHEGRNRVTVAPAST